MDNGVPNLSYTPSGETEKRADTGRAGSMSMILVSYDLHGDKDYEELFESIQALGSNWCRALESLWLITADLTPEQVRDQLYTHIDGDDELFVIDVTGQSWASYLDQEVSAWLRENL